MTYGQTYFPFPLENSQWSNRHRSYELDEWFIPTYTVDWVNNFCALGNDTIINAINYKQVDLCNNSGSDYFGALRYDLGRVYIVPKDSISEYLLYNFTLNSGDTAEVILMNGSAEWPSVDYSFTDVVIQGVDTITVNGTQRRRLDTGGAFWIEGIGNTQGLFMEPWINVSMYFRELICMNANDTLIYDYNGFPQGIEQGIPGTCGLTLGMFDHSQSVPTWGIFPNPSSGQFTLNIENESGRVTITNLSGEILFFQEVPQGETEIALQNFVAGVYIIKLENQHSISTKRLVISE